MVNNYGDRKSPKDQVVGPLPNGLFWLINRGDPNYLVTGMILQVRVATKKIQEVILNLAMFIVNDSSSKQLPQPRCFFYWGAFFSRNKLCQQGFKPELSPRDTKRLGCSVVAPSKRHGLLLGMFFEWQPLGPRD